MPTERQRILGPAQRVRTFQEVHLGLSRGEAVEDARIFLERERSVKGEACPLGTDFFAVLRAVAKNDVNAALDKLIEADPLPAITNRLCADPYFETQVFNRKAERISLRAIARCVADHGRPKKAETEARPRQKVAVIGSGPAGLTAAHVLKRAGFRVTVLETSHILGGTLSYAYPEFRLPPKALETTLTRLQNDGIECVTNTLAGRDVTPAELFDQGFAAVLLSCGAGLSKILGVPGEDAAGILTVEEFLKLRHWMKAGLEPYATPLEVGRKVLIVGGGEKAFDAARVLVRLGREVKLAVDGSESHLGVDPAIVREATEEGVKIHTFARPESVVKDHMHCVKGLVCQHLDYKIDTQGRLNLIVAPESKFTLEADTIITAAGTEPDTLFLRQLPGLQFDTNGSILIKSGTSAETSVSGVFVCGHITDPALSMIGAMNSAKRAVAEIGKFLNVG
jgi:glutamate synthase (NADPH/NADH) small chain